MRTIRYILQKEFLQIFRNKGMLPIIFILPVIQLCVLTFAATYDMKNTNIYIVDKDVSKHTQEIIGKFENSSFFTITGIGFSEAIAEDEFLKDRTDAILVFNKGFGNNLDKREDAPVQLLVNSIDARAASLFGMYIVEVLQEYNTKVITTNSPVGKSALSQRITTSYNHFYNPEMDYISYMLPGILVILVTVIGLFLSAMNVVREREIGTIEQINVTPIKKYQFLIGKLIPFIVIGFFELGVGLLVAGFIFKIPFLGSAWLIYLVASVYLLTILGLGLFISTQTETQQQAMFIAWFIMVIFIMMSGLFTPVESMPEWGQKLNIINPVAYFIKVIRMIMMKGSGFHDIKQYIGVLLVYAVCAISFAVNRYRKVA
ncbi:ABC transporter permease [Puteibacter caeruleilacunae]|nr:ABC transporter permease [Puteibacter caeruleilacunae]